MINDQLFSAHWHRVKNVKPYLAADVNVVHQLNRGVPSWVLHRRSTNKFHRTDIATFELIDRLNGKLTIEEIWEQALVQRSESAPTQDQWLSVLASLQAAELIVVDRRVSAEQLFLRRENQRSQVRKERWQNPLFLRFSLHDPDAWLTQLKPLTQILFSRNTLILWLMLVGAGLIAILINSASIAYSLASSGFPSPQMALLLILVYPPLKLLHELGHALAIKRCGGEVHDMGIVFMVLVPLPYVDASACVAFPDKRDRMLVAAAGIFVELGLAAIGALLWATTVGLLADIGLALLLIGGVSTVLINGNPLLKFDGYYLLADALEIPNLAARSRRSALAKFKSILTGRIDSEKITDDRVERIWLLSYGVASAVYRTVLMLWIAWLLSGRYLIFGLGLAVYVLLTSILMPIYTGLTEFLHDSALRAPRSLAVLSGVPIMLFGFIFWLPMPHSYITQGVIWLPDNAIVRASNTCEIANVFVEPGQWVITGQNIFDCLDPEFAIRVREYIAQIDELDARMSGLAVLDPVEHTRLRSERMAYQSDLFDLRNRIESGHHVAELDGVFDTNGSVSLEGKALVRGDVAGYVVPEKLRTVRVALSETAASRLDSNLRRVELFTGLLSSGKNIHTATLLSRSLRASHEVASAALTTAGGGEHRAEVNGNGRQVVEAVFNVELTWPEDAGLAPVGAHVGVRFVYPPEPIGKRVSDAFRRALNGRKSV